MDQHAESVPTFFGELLERPFESMEDLSSMLGYGLRELHESGRLMGDDEFKTLMWLWKSCRPGAGLGRAGKRSAIKTLSGRIYACLRGVLQDDHQICRRSVEEMATMLDVSAARFSRQYKKISKPREGVQLQLPGQRTAAASEAYSARQKRIWAEKKAGTFVPKPIPRRFKLSKELETVARQAAEKRAISRVAFIRAVKNMCAEDDEKAAALKRLGIEPKKFSGADQAGKFVMISDAVKTQIRRSKTLIEAATVEGAKKPRKWFIRQIAEPLASIFCSRAFGREIIAIFAT